MKDFIKNIKADKLTYRGFIFSLLLTVLTTGYILLYYSKIPPFVPIFNQLPWGPQILVPTPGIFIPVIVFVFLFVFNIIFTSIVYSKSPLIGRIVAGVTLLIAAINFVFAVRTVLLII